jgi:hypothetical protein
MYAYNNHHGYVMAETEGDGNHGNYGSGPPISTAQSTGHGHRVFGRVHVFKYPTSPTYLLTLAALQRSPPNGVDTRG